MTQRARIVGWMVVACMCGVTSSGAAQPRPPRAAAARTLEQLPLLTPIPGAVMGTRSPSVITAAAPDGRWIVVCEARQDTDRDGSINVGLGHHGDTYGDALEPFFVSGSGPGEAIDDFVGTDRSGRWVALIRGGRLVLHDTSNGRDEDLSASGADASTDDSPLGAHRAAGFDQAGERMFYIRSERRGTSVVVRELATGRETAIGVRGVLDRAFLIGDGQWLVTRIVERDTNRDGRISGPRPRTSLGARRCRGPVMSYSTGGSDGDDVSIRVARVGQDTTVRAMPGDVITAIGARLLVRMPDHALVAIAADGARREWTPASCRGVVLALAPTFDRALVGCVGTDDMHAPLEIAGDAGRQSLGILGTAPGYHEPGPVTAVATIDQLRTSATEVPYPTVDFATGRVEQPPASASRDFALTTSNGNELRMRGTTMVARNVAAGTTRPLVRIAEPVYECMTAGRLALCGGALFDVALGRVLGRVRSEPIAVTPDGRVLVRDGRESFGRGGIPPAQFVWLQVPQAPQPAARPPTP